MPLNYKNLVYWLVAALTVLLVSCGSSGDEPAGGGDNLPTDNDLVNITLDPNGGYINGATLLRVKKDDIVTEAPEAKKAGYLLQEWRLADGTPMVWGQPIRQSINLTAHWDENKAVALISIYADEDKKQLYSQIEIPNDERPMEVIIKRLEKDNPEALTRGELGDYGEYGNDLLLPKDLMSFVNSAAEEHFDAQFKTKFPQKLWVLSKDQPPEDFYFIKNKELTENVDLYYGWGDVFKLEKIRDKSGVAGVEISVLNIAGKYYPDEELRIPATINGQPISKIGSVIAGKNIKKIIFPTGIKLIRGISSEDGGLEEVQFNDGLETIGREPYDEMSDNISFAGKVHLKQLVIPASVKTSYLKFSGKGQEVDKLIFKGSPEFRESLRRLKIGQLIFAKDIEFNIPNVNLKRTLFSLYNNKELLIKQVIVHHPNGNDVPAAERKIAQFFSQLRGWGYAVEAGRDLPEIIYCNPATDASCPQ